MRSHGAFIFLFLFSTIILFSGNHFPVPCIIYQESIIYRSLYGFFYHMQMQQENIDTGQYQVTVSDRLNNRPIENARVRISYTGVPDSTIEEVATDSSGRTPVIELKTPPLEYSMEPVEQQPYSEYTIQIEAEGFEPKEIAGSQVLADTLSRQPTTLNVMESGETFQRIVIPPHTLFYEYPPKIEEAEIKPINENGEIVLSKVVVPEYIVVQTACQTDSAAGIIMYATKITSKM